MDLSRRAWVAVVALALVPGVITGVALAINANLGGAPCTTGIVDDYDDAVVSKASAWNDWDTACELRDQEVEYSAAWWDLHETMCEKYEIYRYYGALALGMLEGGCYYESTFGDCSNCCWDAADDLDTQLTECEEATEDALDDLIYAMQNLGDADQAEALEVYAECCGVEDGTSQAKSNLQGHAS